MKANEPGDKAMEKVLMTTDDVKKVIPHRAPMLLVDNVVQMEPEQSITTTWHIDPEREIFKGHFPGDPVLPGVYTVENMAQTADILILSTERYAGKVPLFLGVNNVKFLAKILPGDTLEDYECYTCEMDLDEDELVRFLSDAYYDCPYYRNGDEYRVVRKQL